MKYLDFIINMKNMKMKIAIFVKNVNVIAVKKTFIFIFFIRSYNFHFQRKEKRNYNKIKINFPFEYLDLNPYSYNRVNKIYDLIGTINRDNNNGHYNWFCKNDINKKCYLFNDLTCFQIEDLSKESKYEDVYMLIYKNRNNKEYVYEEDKNINN